MWKRKAEKEESEEEEPKTYEEELRQRMEEQFEEKKRRETESKDDVKKEEDKQEIDDPASNDGEEMSKNSLNTEVIKKVSTSQLTMDEIEEIRKKREKNLKKKKEEKEEGEIPDEDEKSSSKRSRNKRPRDREDGELRSDEERHSSRKRYRSGSRDRRGYNSYHRDDRRYSRDYRYRSDRRHSPYRSRGRHYRSPSPKYRSSRRRYERSRSRSRDRGFRGSRAAVDKEKLLAIAKKNAVKLLSSDNLMGMDHARLMAIKSGGQSLSQLTDFCRELAKKGITNEFDEEDAIANGSDSDTEFHHPFMVKDKPLPAPLTISAAPGSSLLQAGITCETLTPAMKNAAKTHRMLEFPVSSGNAHRVKETTATEPEAPKAITHQPDPIPETSSSEDKVAEDNKDELQKLNAQNPLGVIMFGGQVADEPLKAIEGPKTETAEGEATKTVEETKIESIAPLEPPKEEESVFSEIEKPVEDISAIVSQRLLAMKKLSSNPQDSEALKLMHDAQGKMTSWAASKNKPGQFTGHTGAKVLSKGELSQGIQAWAKQEQFTAAKKVSYVPFLATRPPAKYIFNMVSVRLKTALIYSAKDWALWITKAKSHVF